jgi:hypothetical protein
MDLEISALQNKQTIVEILRSQVSPGKLIFKSTSVFPKKSSKWEIYKLKARFVVRWDLQILDGPQSTFSPMVSCSTFYLLFVLTIVRKLHSITIAFINAFIQSTLPEPVYLELPPGYASPKGTNHVYKVSESLFGEI